MGILADSENQSKRAYDSTYQISFNSSRIATFRACKTLIFGPLFPLVERVGKNGFWYNNKSG